MTRSAVLCVSLLGIAAAFLLAAKLFDLWAGPRVVWSEARQKNLALARARVLGQRFASHESHRAPKANSNRNKPPPTHGIDPAAATDEALVAAELELQRLEADFQATVAGRNRITSMLQFLALSAAVAGVGVYGFERLKASAEN